MHHSPPVHCHHITQHPARTLPSTRVPCPIPPTVRQEGFVPLTLRLGGEEGGSQQQQQRQEKTRSHGGCCGR